MKRTALLVAMLVGGCGGQLDNDVGVGGETHFLVTCGDDCGAGLTCLEGVCTRRCEPGFSSCTELASTAECVPDLELAQSEPFGGTCDVRCGSDADCAELGSGYACVAGACRAEPEARRTDLSPLGSLRQPLVRAVDGDTCLTGLRWVGGDRPSAEMHPGTDCLSCHGETDALPFLFAGTVYAFRDDRLAITTPEAQPLDGCFGIEGITVTITDGNGEGRVRSTTTNRAGNFYFEGRHSDVVWPYTASVSFSRGGRRAEAPMFTLGFYGGCARCHYLPSDAPVSGPLPRDRRLDDTPEAIISARSVLYAYGFFDF